MAPPPQAPMRQGGGAPPPGPGSRPWTGTGPAPERKAGTLISFNPERFFGFIHCPELEADVWVCAAQVGKFKVGDEVTFHITPSKQGKPQAQALESANPGEVAGTWKRQRVA